MPNDFFMNAMMNGLIQMPNEQFRERQQAAIDQKWEVTTNRYTVQEQDDIGSEAYHDVEVWISNAMGMTTRGEANGEDFKHFTFRCIDHPTKRGLYYRFNGNVWLTHFTDDFDARDVAIGVRRCNNVMKIIDPENGSVFCIPCVIDYDATASNPQITGAIITPNNHISVKVQGNEMTNRLFKLNSRFIFGCRPFKLIGYQNAIIDKEIYPQDSLLSLEFALDEIHAKDDLEKQIADNGDYDYVIEIDSDNMELIKGSTGSLNASVTLNGVEVNRKVKWESLSPTVVSIDDKGQYTVVGKEGNTCTITASLKGNPDVNATIEVKVVADESMKPKIIIEPSFVKIRQYETIKFEVQVAYGSMLYRPDITSVEIDKDVVSIEKNGNNYTLTGQKISSEPVVLTVKAQNQKPSFVAESDFKIEAVSMLG